MKLYEALSFCNEVEKVTTKKKRLTLLDAYVVCERFRRKIGKKALNEKRDFEDGSGEQNHVENTHEQSNQQKKLDKGDMINVGPGYKIIEHTKNISTIPLVADTVQAKAQIHPDIFHDYLDKFLSVRTKVGMVKIDSKAIENHWLNKAKFMSQSELKAEIRWRKRLARFFIQTLRNPHEIWLSYRNNEWSYVFIRKFHADFGGEMKDMVLIAIVPVKTLSVKTYYGEKRNLVTAEKKYRRVYLIHKR